MGLIKSFDQLQMPKTIKAMIYGSPGTGKTTLGCSTPHPLLLDFDNGVSRVNIEHLRDVDTIQVSTWEEVLQMFDEDLSKYETIVVDTIGKMLDYIIAYKCGRRAPSIKDWSGINNEFQTFVNRVSGLGKHVVFIAHRDTRREGDDTVFIPTLREKNYSYIITELDLLGYIEMKSENGRTRRTITFNPTERNDGKNTCNLPALMTIPELINNKGEIVQENDTLTRLVLTPYINMIQVKEDATKQYEALIKQVKEDIARLETADEANDFVANINTRYNHTGSSLAMARSLFLKRVQDLGLEYDKKAKAYKEKVEPETETTTEETEAPAEL